jgi:FMN-dependent NADH-azoreductase
MTTLLKINSSARYKDSVSRQLTDKLVEKIADSTTTIIERDLNQEIHFISEASLNAVNRFANERNPEQQALAKVADTMIKELQQADIVVIGAPVYNFGAPASLKAWADLVARAGTTFKYSENGPVGLLENKKAYLVAVSGGTVIGSDADFMTPWIKFFLGFIGIKEVEIIVADSLVSQDGTEKIKAANQTIDALNV